MDNNKESGQSTIEFILTFAFGVSLILIIFNTALNQATGYLVQYATFMASRVYLVADSHIAGEEASLNGAEQLAKDAFNTYNLSIFNISNENFRINSALGNDANTYPTVGGVTTFELPIDLLGKLTGQKKLELVSESFLGKEPTRGVCAERVCFAITGTTNCEVSMDLTLYDDGC